MNVPRKVQDATASLVETTEYLAKHRALVREILEVHIPSDAPESAGDEAATRPVSKADVACELLMLFHTCEELLEYHRECTGKDKR